MLRKILLINKNRLSNFDEINVGVLSSLVLLVFATIHALHFFKQFSAFNVITVALFFLSLYAATIGTLTNVILRRKIGISALELIAICLTVYFALLIYYSSFKFALFLYLPPFPLLNLENQSGLHQDPAFHTALINSIINFGYPSFAGHTNSIVKYHALSHYIEAIIFYISDVDPLEGIGLLSLFKVWIALSVFITFLSNLSRGGGFFFYAFLILLVTPVLADNWRIINSHSMWVAAIALFPSCCLLYKVIYKKIEITPLVIFALFGATVVLTLSKTSVGFIFFTFSSLCLILTNCRKKTVYTYILSSLIFSYFFIDFISSNHRGYSEILFTSPMKAIEDLLVNFKLIMGTFVSPNEGSRYLNKADSSLGIVTSLALLFVLSITHKKMGQIAVLASAICIFFGLFLILNSKALSTPDKTYFVISFKYIIVIFTVAAIAKWYKNFNDKHISLLPIARKMGLRLFFGVTFSLLSLYGYSNTNVNILNMSPYYFRSSLFFFESNLAIDWTDYYSGKWRRYIIETKNDIGEMGYIPSQTKMFVSKEQFELFKKLTTDKARPAHIENLTVYSMTGIPLIHGFEPVNNFGYGLHGFPEASRWKSALEFDATEACKGNPGSLIIVPDFSGMDNHYIHCEGRG